MENRLERNKSRGRETLVAVMLPADDNDSDQGSGNEQEKRGTLELYFFRQNGHNLPMNCIWKEKKEEMKEKQSRITPISYSLHPPCHLSFSPFPSKVGQSIPT